MTPAADRYVFATAFAREEERLALGEALWDPGTRERLAATGVGPGWSCLEIGAGRGSVAAWLADRVGPVGEVVAADLDTERLKWLTGRGVTVHRHDVVTDDLPEAHFDLIHARLVLQHVGDRQQAVDRLYRALKPGGHLVLEDTDTASLFSHPAQDDFLNDVKRAAYDVMCASGYHPRCGLLDVQLATDAGLVDIVAEGRSAVVRGGSDAARWFALWLEHLAPAMLARGAVTEERLARAQVDLTDPAHCWLSQVMVTVHGRRPASDSLGKVRTAP
ncbi:methyltransferase domain-containing protein [Streptomyces sp. NBC_01525]|uniref:class I SAM-dependent methyltransferase n=1 Tax=Streptomyces TaxID=1883 RepID=UPI001C8F8939|nr:methyltransferase domain-containing protein [Streptomyces benahoarensis]